MLEERMLNESALLLASRFAENPPAEAVYSGFVAENWLAVRGPIGGSRRNNFCT